MNISLGMVGLGQVLMWAFPHIIDSPVEILNAIETPNASVDVNCTIQGISLRRENRRKCVAL